MRREIDHSRFLWFSPSHPILTAISTVWFGDFISRQNLGWWRNSNIPRSSGIFSTYENQTWAISYWAYTSVCETDTVLPILLCKTNLDTSSLPELAKVKLSKASQLYFKKCIVQSNRKYQVEVLLEIESQLNGRTIGFHPQTQKLKLHTK